MFRLQLLYFFILHVFMSSLLLFFQIKEALAVIEWAMTAPKRRSLTPILTPWLIRSSRILPMSRHRLLIREMRSVGTKIRFVHLLSSRKKGNTEPWLRLSLGAYIGTFFVKIHFEPRVWFMGILLNTILWFFKISLLAYTCNFVLRLFWWNLSLYYEISTKFSTMCYEAQFYLQFYYNKQQQQPNP